MTDHITPREREVVAAVVAGSRPKEIARSLGISPRTVECHIEHARAKLGARNVQELVRLALTKGVCRPTFDWEGAQRRLRDRLAARGTAPRTDAAIRRNRRRIGLPEVPGKWEGAR